MSKAEEEEPTQVEAAGQPSRSVQPLYIPHQSFFVEFFSDPESLVSSLVISWFITDMMKLHLPKKKELVKGQRNGTSLTHIGEFVKLENFNLLLIFWIKGCKFYLASENS